MPEHTVTLNNKPLGQSFSDALNAAGQSLEKTSHDYYIIAKMLGSDAGTMGGIRVNQSGRVQTPTHAKKDKTDSHDMMYLLLLHDIAQMEAQLEAKYGENFAEELAEKYLDEATYQRLIGIEDQDERRRQTALALKQGIEGGTVDPAGIDSDPQIREWIEARAAQAQAITYAAALEVQGASNRIDGTDIDQSYAIKADSHEANALNKIF